MSQFHKKRERNRFEIGTEAGCSPDEAHKRRCEKKGTPVIASRKWEDRRDHSGFRKTKWTADLRVPNIVMTHSLLRKEALISRSVPGQPRLRCTYIHVRTYNTYRSKADYELSARDTQRRAVTYVSSEKSDRGWNCSTNKEKGGEPTDKSNRCLSVNLSKASLYIYYHRIVR